MHKKVQVRSEKDGIELPDLKPQLRSYVDVSMNSGSFHTFPNLSPTVISIGSENPKEMVIYQTDGIRFVMDGDSHVTLTPRKNDYRRPLEIRKMTQEEEKTMVDAMNSGIRDKPDLKERLTKILDTKTANMIQNN